MSKLNLVSRENEIWTVLKAETRPILIYGMGIGAEKIAATLKDKGIEYECVFASDSYVRGHEFLGKKVIKYSDAVAKYGDFVILLAFGVFKEEMLAHMKDLDKKHTFFAPEVALFGGGTFDYDYVERNLPQMQSAYDKLADEKSRIAFENVLNFKITGKIKYLEASSTPREEVFENIIKLGKNESYLDLGAYDGDTIYEFLDETGGDFNSIIALEPDRKNFKKLVKNTADLKGNIELMNIGIWKEKDELKFAQQASRSSSIGEEGQIIIEVDSIDNIVSDKDCTYIKMDVESVEKEALLGGIKTLNRCKPKLAVSAYHRHEDMFYLVNLIDELCDVYDIYMRHHPYIPAWETNIYAVKREV